MTIFAGLSVAIGRRTQFLQGQILSLDDERQTLELTQASGNKRTLDYDQLVFALEREADFSTVPGLVEHAVPMMTIGDGLYLRQRVLESMERAEPGADDQARKSDLTFCVIGAGVLGSGTAAELRELINSALISYPGIGSQEVRVVLIERRTNIIPHYDADLGNSARRRLEHLGVEVLTNATVSAVTADGVVFSSGDRIRCGTVIGALKELPTIVSSLADAQPGRGVEVDEFLRAPGAENIYVVSDCATFLKRVPFLVLREIRMGARAAYNAWAASQGFKLRRWSDREPLAYLVALGRHATVGRILGIPVGGIPAWMLARMLCLLTLPGLERNLRVLID